MIALVFRQRRVYRFGSNVKLSADIGEHRHGADGEYR
jgi:hypothetical protein